MYVSPILYIDIAVVVELILPFKRILNLPSEPLPISYNVSLHHETYMIKSEKLVTSKQPLYWLAPP